VTEDGVVANILTRAEKGSGYRQVCSICQQQFESTKLAYAHIKAHGAAVRVQKIVAECFAEETTIPRNTIIDESIARASEGNGCVEKLCSPQDASARDVTEVSDNAGAVDGLEERTFDLERIDADCPIEYDRNELDGDGEIGEQFMVQFPPDSDVHEGDHAFESEEELNAPFVSEESIAERIATVAYANANTTSDFTMNEDILRSSLASTFEELQGGEDDNLETDARDDYGIAFQEECLSNMCRAADLAGIGQHENALDESEFDIAEVARELSLAVDPDNPRSISLGQYCIDQLMIMQVICPYVLISIRLKTQYIIYDFLGQLNNILS
jgi:hypothetical protein